MRWVCAVASTLLSTDALACGGFFCGGGPPVVEEPVPEEPPPDRVPAALVEQTSERIVFVQSGERVRAIIQIQYDGDPVDFAWIIPVPSPPTIGTTDPAIFSVLDEFTKPEWIYPGADADTDVDADADASGSDAASSSAGCACALAGCSWEHYSDPDGRSSFQFESIEGIGAYAVAVVTADRTSDLTDWIERNVYTVPPEALPIIDHYVEQGFFFVAVRMQASADVKTIEPLVLEFEADEPCVPLRLTSIAAQPDMEVLLWVVGDSQATPMGAYSRVSAPMAGGEGGYVSRLSDAIDEAGGSAFAVEYAAPTRELPFLGGWSAEAEEIVRSGAYLTRLRTRMDPEEMSVDPLFGFDPDLADVSNVRRESSRAEAAPLVLLAAFAALLSRRARWRP